MRPARRARPERLPVLRPPYGRASGSRRLTSALVVALATVAFAACGGDDVVYAPVPGDPPPLSVPQGTDGDALAAEAPADAGGGEAAADDGVTITPADPSEDAATGDTGAAAPTVPDTTTDDAIAPAPDATTGGGGDTAAPDAGTGGDVSGGGTTAPSTAGPEDGGGAEAPPATGGAEAGRFQAFCERNPGACP